MFERWSQGICVSLLLAAAVVWETERFPEVNDLYLIVIPGLVGVLVSSLRINGAYGHVGAGLMRYGLFVYLVGLSYRVGAGYAYRTGCAPREAFEFCGYLWATLVWPPALLSGETLMRIAGARDKAVLHPLPNSARLR